jgi:hypothetical protein
MSYEEVGVWDLKVCRVAGISCNISLSERSNDGAVLS